MKLPLPSTFLAATAFFSLAATGAWAQTMTNLVTNGDFSANAAAFTQFPGYLAPQDPNNPAEISGYISSGTNSGVNGNGLGAGTAFAPHNYGGQGTDVADFLFIQGNGSVSQTISLIAGHTYTLSFESAPRINDGALDGATSSVTIRNNGATLVSAPGDEGEANYYSDPFTRSAVTFVAPGNTLGFSTISLSDDYTGTDDNTEDFANLSVVDVTPAGVPEPSTYALLGLGALGLGFVCRCGMKTA